MYLHTDRAEVNGEIELTAVVADREARPPDISYNWSATGGPFTGSGGKVRWRVPAVAVPSLQPLKRDLVERCALYEGLRWRLCESLFPAGLTSTFIL